MTGSPFGSGMGIMGAPEPVVMAPRFISTSSAIAPPAPPAPPSPKPSTTHLFGGVRGAMVPRGLMMPERVALPE